MIVQGKARYPVNRVMLHTSATPSNWWKGKTVEEMRDEIRRWHTLDRGWRDIGYHRVFAPDGTMALGRSLYEIGAGCRGENCGVVHLCMVPTVWIDRMGTFEDFYTLETRVAVRDYLLELEELHGAPLIVVGHNHYAPKLCPGFKVVSDEWL
jgi:hypothetical protein